MAEPRITGITLSEGERDRALGVLARFSFDYVPMRVRGCALVLSAEGVPLASLPQCKSDAAAVRFSDHEVRLQVSRAALAALRALGGRLPTE
ncbi:hypothetical protein ABS772_06275 [Methylorubrum podarium]|uniref:Uncharacterized protein n=1 Tax=Methylorubrum podarium TaxID=200476 RepID=A0ABV1QJF8_9HYPH